MLKPVTNWLLASFVVFGVAATAVWATGCSSKSMPMMGCMGMMGNMNHSTDTMAATTQPAKPVNAVCPIMGGKVNPALTRQFKGKTVGFCCPMCPPKWDKLTDKQKQAKLDKVMGK